MIPWKSSRPDHVVRRNTKKLESGAPFLSARRCEGNDESVLKLCANCPWKVFQGKNIILNSRWISKGKENLTSIGRIRTTKGGEKGKKGRDKVFLLHQLFNFAIPCLVILNRVTSDELSIREPFELVCNDVFEAEPYKMEQTHVFESSSYSLPNVSSFRSDEIFLYP